MSELSTETHLGSTVYDFHHILRIDIDLAVHNYSPPNVDIAFRRTHDFEYHKGYADELGHTPILFNDSLYSLEMP